MRNARWRRFRKLSGVSAVLGAGWLLGLGLAAGLGAELGGSRGEAQTVRAGEPAPQLLWPAGAPGALGTAPEDQPALVHYLPAQNPTGAAVVIAPGGGYGMLAFDKEGTDFARWWTEHGVAAFVLRYRLGPRYHHPVELGDAQRAIRTVRAQAAALHLNPDRIGMMGFSAGGHLAATAGTHFDAGRPGDADPIERVSSRPDFLILAYPVITMEEPFVHRGSRDNLLGTHPDPPLVRSLSADEAVTAATPPTFLFATTDDTVVPVMNSVLFYTALVRNRVPAEMHLFQHGPHGVGMARQFPELAAWPDLLVRSMEARGLLVAARP